MNRYLIRITHTITDNSRYHTTEAECDADAIKAAKSYVSASCKWDVSHMRARIVRATYIHPVEKAAPVTVGTATIKAHVICVIIGAVIGYALNAFIG